MTKKKSIVVTDPKVIQMHVDSSLNLAIAIKIVASIVILVAVYVVATKYLGMKLPF